MLNEGDVLVGLEDTSRFGEEHEEIQVEDPQGTEEARQGDRKRKGARSSCGRLAPSERQVGETSSSAASRHHAERDTHESGSQKQAGLTGI